MSIPESDTFKPESVESKRESSEAVDNPELDRTKVLQERNDLDKDDETRTKIKLFTLGDGGFGIDGLDEARDSVLSRIGEPKGGSGGDSPPEQPKSSEVEEKPDDKPVFGAGIKRDESGRPTEVEYPNGKSNKIEYDDDGNVKSMRTAEGNTVVREGDHWVVTEPNGQKKEWKGEVTVSEDGDIAVTGEDGGATIRHADGSKTIIDKDGMSQQTRDINDRVTSITYPNGKTNKIEYDDNGDVKAMRTAEGNTVVREGDHWVVTEPNGQKKEWKGEVSVSEDGDIAVTGEDGGATIRHADGSKTTIDKDGMSQQTRDINDRVTSITYPDGKTNKVEYDDDGNVKAMHTAEGNTVVREGDHWVVTEPNGQKKEWRGEVHVSEDGEITVRNPDGTGSVRRANGVKEPITG